MLWAWEKWFHVLYQCENGSTMKLSNNMLDNQAIISKTMLSSNLTTGCVNNKNNIFIENRVSHFSLFPDITVKLLAQPICNRKSLGFATGQGALSSFRIGGEGRKVMDRELEGQRE